MISNFQSNSQSTANDAEKIIGKLVPAQIKDQEAYEEYERLRNNPLLNEKKYIFFSTGRKLSLGTIHHRLEALIAELPEDEKKRIRLQKKMYNSILCKANAKLRKAYGTMVDGEGRYQTKDHKFSNINREMIELFGRMFSAKEVHEIVVKNFMIPCQLQAVLNFRERHIVEINARTEEHKRTYSDIRLGYKRSRLEELTWIYGTRKRIYEATKKGDDHRLLLMTLEQIRKEIEGDVSRMDLNLNVNVEATINEHINRELFVNFPLKEIIMARVAARAKTNVEHILLELNKSYYNNYLNQQTEDQGEMPAYPSTQTYDFDRIRRINIQADRLKEVEAGKIKVNKDEGRIKSANTIKEMLLKKLQNKSEIVNTTKDKLAGHFVDKANKD